MIAISSDHASKEELACLLAHAPTLLVVRMVSVALTLHAELAMSRITKIAQGSLVTTQVLVSPMSALDQ